MGRTAKNGMAWLTALLLGGCMTGGAEMVLYDFGGGFAFERVEARDVKVSEAKAGDGSQLRMDTGHAQDWPGITLPAPGGHWDLSAFTQVELDVRNVGDNEVTVCCRVDNPGADGVRNCNTASVTLKPGESGVLTVPLNRKPVADPTIELFGMRGYPPPFGGGGDRTLDPAGVTQVLVFVPKPTEAHAFEIDNLRAAGVYAQPETFGMTAAEFFPLIDTFGQYVHREWPGKVASLEDLRSRIAAEAADLGSHPGPEGWNEYGGWEAGPTLEATGFFHPAKHEGQWWLVDPQGKLFWSHGVDCVNGWDNTPISEREHWFADYPGGQPEFAEFVSTAGHIVHGDYVGKKPTCFDFAAANLKRKFGDDWQRAHGELAHRRLRSWGMNTIANWSDAGIYLMRKTPYCVSIHFGGKALQGSEGYWGQFRDVFDPSFAAALRQTMAGQVGKSAGDPWCLGYFVDNELSWGDDTSLAVAALVSPPDQVAKQVFIADLRAKYETIGKLNEAWGSQHASWDALLRHREKPDVMKAKPDLQAFYRKTAEQYFRVCRDEVKRVAPDNLYLGCRLAWTNDVAAAASAKYCDVVSYNLYRRDVSSFRMPGDPDVPVIIGEFHFGALDRGLFHTGLVPVADQDARAEAYRSYVQGCLANPWLVGCGWFKFRDECTTGRPLDEENYQIGLLDICDSPYPETIAAVREVGYGMYETRAGR
ncbi:MAG: beta-agarase [Armatimonadetes bacterium]|nr:beta-agarase [Armatimonadota bacterium]